MSTSIKMSTDTSSTASLTISSGHPNLARKPALGPKTSLGSPKIMSRQKAPAQSPIVSATTQEDFSRLDNIFGGRNMNRAAENVMDTYDHTGYNAIRSRHLHNYNEAPYQPSHMRGRRQEQNWEGRSNSNTNNTGLETSRAEGLQEGITRNSRPFRHSQSYNRSHHPHKTVTRYTIEQLLDMWVETPFPESFKEVNVPNLMTEQCLPPVRSDPQQIEKDRQALLASPPPPNQRHPYGYYGSDGSARPKYASDVRQAPGLPAPRHTDSSWSRENWGKTSKGAAAFSFPNRHKDIQESAGLDGEAERNDLTFGASATDMNSEASWDMLSSNAQRFEERKIAETAGDIKKKSAPNTDTLPVPIQAHHLEESLKSYSNADTGSSVPKTISSMAGPANSGMNLDLFASISASQTTNTDSLSDFSSFILGSFLSQIGLDDEPTSQSTVTSGADGMMKDKTTTEASLPIRDETKLNSSMKPTAEPSVGTCVQSTTKKPNQSGGVTENEPKKSGDVESDARWYYLDPRQRVQGPFSSEDMRAWLKAGYFKRTLPVRRAHETEYVPLSQIYPDMRVAFKAPQNVVSNVKPVDRNQVREMSSNQTSQNQGSGNVDRLNDHIFAARERINGWMREHKHIAQLYSDLERRHAELQNQEQNLRQALSQGSSQMQQLQMQYQHAQTTGQPEVLRELHGRLQHTQAQLQQLSDSLNGVMQGIADNQPKLSATQQNLRALTNKIELGKMEVLHAESRRQDLAPSISSTSSQGFPTNSMYNGNSGPSFSPVRAGGQTGDMAFNVSRPIDTQPSQQMNQNITQMKMVAQDFAEKERLQKQEAEKKHREKLQNQKQSAWGVAAQNPAVQTKPTLATARHREQNKSAAWPEPKPVSNEEPPSKPANVAPWAQAASARKNQTSSKSLLEIQAEEAAKALAQANADRVNKHNALVNSDAKAWEAVHSAQSSVPAASNKKIGKGKMVVPLSTHTDNKSQASAWETTPGATKRSVSSLLSTRQELKSRTDVPEPVPIQRPEPSGSAWKSTEVQDRPKGLKAIQAAQKAAEQQRTKEVQQSVPKSGQGMTFAQRVGAQSVPTQSAWGVSPIVRANPPTVQQAKSMAANEAHAPKTGPSSPWVAAAGGGKPTTAPKQKSSQTNVSQSPQTTKKMTKPVVNDEDAEFWDVKDTNDAKNDPDSEMLQALGATEMKPEFRDWCLTKLSEISNEGSLQLAYFGSSLKSRREILDFWKLYLGDSDKIKSFAGEFADRLGYRAPRSQTNEAWQQVPKTTKRKGRM